MYLDKLAQKIIVTTLRIPESLHNKLLEMLQYEIETEENGVIKKETKKKLPLNKFIIKILEDFVKNGYFTERTVNKQLDEYKVLIQKQEEFLTNLDMVLRTTASENPAPANFDELIKKIELFLGASKRRLSEIAEGTGMKEIDVLICLGHLYDQNKISYNQKFQYFLI